MYTKLDTSPNADPNHNYKCIVNETNQAKNLYMTSKFVKLYKCMHNKSTQVHGSLLT